MLNPKVLRLPEQQYTLSTQKYLPLSGVCCCLNAICLQCKRSPAHAEDHTFATSYEAVAAPHNMRVQVCDHPFLLADPEQADSGAADALSGKLVVLDKLLRHLHSHNHKVLLLSHHPKVPHLNPLLPGSIFFVLHHRHAVVIHGRNIIEGRLSSFS